MLEFDSTEFAKTIVKELSDKIEVKFVDTLDMPYVRTIQPWHITDMYAGTAKKLSDIVGKQAASDLYNLTMQGDVDSSDSLLMAMDGIKKLGGKREDWRLLLLVEAVDTQPDDLGTRYYIKLRIRLERKDQ